MTRVTFLIDGFNLYHSVKNASRDLGLRGAGTRWLNIWALCASYISIFGRAARLSEIYYFSALATHLEAANPDVTRRHRRYIECLEDTGVTVEMGRFKAKDVRCPSCHSKIIRHEEKETDVAISIKLLELCILDQCDVAVIITGDTDVAPAIRSVLRLFSDKRIVVGFPYRRHNAELKLLAHQAFDIKKERYQQYQFPDPFTLTDGRAIAKPPLW
jgi:uncharacterized LabA/DUF88 family protein